MRTWEQYRRWLRAARGLEHPRSAGDFVDDLFDRSEEPCGRSVLRGAYDMLRFAEEMAGTPKEARISEQMLVKSSLKGLMAEAAAVGPKKRGGQAPRPFVAMVGLLEDLVMRDGEPLFSRLLAWWMILSTWGILRFDDHRGLIINDILDSVGGWVFMLVRTKTTGPDKAVEARPGIVSRGAYVRQAAWCETGVRLWKEAAPNARDYALALQTRQAVAMSASWGMWSMRDECGEYWQL